jgi:hypothetical protein
MRWIAALAIALSACGGGPTGSPDEPTKSPPTPDVTAQVVQEWGEEFEAVIAEYETARVQTEQTASAAGIFSSAAQYQSQRDLCINWSANWAQRARQALTDAETGANTTNRVILSNLVEDYRQDFMDYMLASYDNFDSRANFGGIYPPQVRQEIIDGIHAVFDDLQADV